MNTMNTKSTMNTMNRPQPSNVMRPSVNPTTFKDPSTKTLADHIPSNGLSTLLKGMESLNSDKENGSQMVTIRRVMDPSSAEPTVTITLKGEEPEKDKVLFKLVNGQGKRIIYN